MKLIAQLRALGAHTRASYPDRMMSAGCGVYAYAVAARLHWLGVPTWGVIASWAGKLNGANLDTITANRKPRNAEEWLAAGVRVSHVLVQFVLEGRPWTHDCDNTVEGMPERDPTCGWPIVDGRLTVVQMRALARDPRGWSRKFDRRTGIPLIHRNVRHFL